jgi:hypothetical protein
MPRPNGATARACCAGACAWRCTACGHEAQVWGPACAKCGAFDRAAWSQPEPVVKAALTDSDAAALLYRLAPPSGAAEASPIVPEEPGDWIEGR